MNIEDAKAWLGDDANPTNIENTIGMYQIYPNYDIQLQPTVDAAKKLFGYEIKLDDDIYLTETNWMEDVYYSPKTKALYYSVGGGDVVAPRYIYKYKFSTEDNKAYVYFAFVQCDPSIYDNTPSGTCIDGFSDSVVNATSTKPPNASNKKLCPHGHIFMQLVDIKQYPKLRGSLLLSS